MQIYRMRWDRWEEIAADEMARDNWVNLIEAKCPRGYRLESPEPYGWSTETYSTNPPHTHAVWKAVRK